MQIDYIEQNDRNVIKYEPVIFVYNNNDDEIARYDSNVIKSMKIDEACHEKNGANVGNFVGRLMDLSLNLDRNNLDMASFCYHTTMYYLDDENCLLYPFDANGQPDTTQPPIGLTYDDAYYQEDVEHLGIIHYNEGEEYEFHYEWSGIGIGLFFPTDVKYNRDNKTYELELSDIPSFLDSTPVSVIVDPNNQYVTFETMLDFVAFDIAQINPNVEIQFEIEPTYETYLFDYHNKDLTPSLREVIANMAFVMNANAYMEYAGTGAYTSIILRRFGTNEHQYEGNWVQSDKPIISQEKLDDYYFEQSAPFNGYLQNISLEHSYNPNDPNSKDQGKKYAMTNWAYGYVNIKNRLWGQDPTYSLTTLARTDSVLNYLQSWEYKGEAMWHIRAGDCVQVEGDTHDLYIGQITTSFEEGKCSTTMQQKLLVSGDSVMIQVSGDNSYTIESYTPPSPTITNFSNMTLPNLKNTLNDFYNGNNNPTITPNKITWENGTEWNIGDTIDIDIAAIPSGQSYITSHNATTVTFKIIGIQQDTIAGTNTKALLSLWACTPYLDDNSLLPYNSVSGEQYKRWQIFWDSYLYYSDSTPQVPADYDPITNGWFSQHQIMYYVSSSANQAAWSSNLLEPWLDTVFVTALPQEIQDSLKTVDKKYFQSGKSTYPTVVNYTTKAFSLAEQEILGLNQTASLYTGARPNYGAQTTFQYKFFENNIQGCMISYDWGRDTVHSYLTYKDFDCIPFWLRTQANQSSSWCTIMGSSAEATQTGKVTGGYGGWYGAAVQPCICL